MLSKAQNKYIRSLAMQKYRKENKVYIVEGEKIAKEWLESTQSIKMIVATADWMQTHHRLVSRHSHAEAYIVSDNELNALSNLQQANKVLLVVEEMPKAATLPAKGWIIALDRIQDPGNMGTIIRIADWFGIEHIVCAAECVEAFNPKVIQAAMGGHLRVTLHYTHLDIFLQKSNLPRLAATLQGENLFDYKAPREGILIIGNESKGISANILELADQELMIPRYGGAESLNAAVSTGIFCAQLTRK